MSYAKFSRDIKNQNAASGAGIIQSYSSGGGQSEVVRGANWTIDPEGDAYMKSASIEHFETDNLYVSRNDDSRSLIVTQDTFTSTHTNVSFSNMSVTTMNLSTLSVPELTGIEKLNIVGSSPQSGYVLVAQDNQGTLAWQALNPSGGSTQTDLTVTNNLEVQGTADIGTATGTSLTTSGAIQGNSLTDGTATIGPSGHIQGVAKFSLGSPAGTAGYFLQATDNAGGVTWAQASGQTTSTDFEVTNEIDINKLKDTSDSIGTAGQFLTSLGAGGTSWLDFPVSVDNWTVNTQLTSTTASDLAAATCTTLVASGNITGLKMIVTSDERLKEDIEPLETDIGAVLKLRPVSYKFKGHQGISNGFLAQEVDELIDNIVDKEDEDRYLMDMNGLVPHLVNCIKKLNNRIDYLESKIIN